MKTKTLIAAFIIALSLPAAAAARGHHGWHMNQQYQNDAGQMQPGMGRHANMQRQNNCPRQTADSQQAGQMQPGMGRKANMQHNINCPRQTANSQQVGQMQPGMGRNANMQRKNNCPYAAPQPSGDAQ
ncbi:hypothetical protein [Psychromonas ossibalaenae]|uniref:hypothetical protein n=1 Tax=Psychromonas ossibalaenae TaxID=444922 RepID=UPI000381BD46|nr:hypothetical protein [Psychromonas ossibalaenae]